MIHILCLSPSPMPPSCSADRPGPYISGHIISELFNCLRLAVTHYVPSHDNANHQPTSIRLQWTRIQKKRTPITRTDSGYRPSQRSHVKNSHNTRSRSSHCCPPKLSKSTLAVGRPITSSTVRRHEALLANLPFFQTHKDEEEEEMGT